jgi:hypothetical protein
MSDDRTELGQKGAAPTGGAMSDLGDYKRWIGQWHPQKCEIELAAAQKREERLVNLLGMAQTTCDGIAGHQCCCELCHADATRMSAAIAVELEERP